MGLVEFRETFEARTLIPKSEDKDVIIQMARKSSAGSARAALGDLGMVARTLWQAWV
jgi:hypothetical protein